MTESGESKPYKPDDLPWYLVDMLVDKRKSKPSKAEQEARSSRWRLRGPDTFVVGIVPTVGTIAREGDLFVETVGSPAAGRPPDPKWANPFSAKEFGARAAVEKYRHHILTRPDLLRDIHELKGKALGCWSAPGPCHAEVLAELVNMFCNGFTGRVLDALVYAATIHKGQMRKGTDIPYVTHVIGVADIVKDHWGGEDEVVAALLHDAIEDAGGAARREDIRKRFGNAVTAIVDGCTDTDQDPKPPWRQRKEAYIEHLRKCKSHSVLLVSASDKLHNARSILEDLSRHGESVWDRFNGKKEGTLWYYKTLVDVYRDKVRFGGWRGEWPRVLVMRLEEVVSKMETAKRALSDREQLLSAIGEYPDEKNQPDTSGKMTEDGPWPPYP